MTAFAYARRNYELTFAARPQLTRVRLDVHAAKRLLGAQMKHATRMRELRSLLGTRSPGDVISRMTDVQVVDHLATRIAARQLHVYTDVSRPVSYVSRPTEQAEEALGPMSATVVEEPVDDNVDVAAQAAALLQAARDGTPFCEECEKARLAELAAAKVPPDPYVDTDVAAQAAALQQAAADGVPFCEECERARAAEDSGAPAEGG
jgi:hypothetical protein